MLQSIFDPPLVRSLITADLGIGIPGQQGFGVGVPSSLPAGFVALPGSTNPTSDNYGNYTYSDGSVMVFIPAFWLRRGHVDNPTYAVYGVNSIDVKPLSAFGDEPTANALGYYMHRAFYNAGVWQSGFFRDKYDCSLNGTIASSIKNAMPLVSDPVAGQTGFSACKANGQAPTNSYAGAIPAARSRGGQFFPETVFMADAISTLSEAHAQAATSTTYCAWYDASGVMNFPKGNNNALKDANDTTVTFTSAGSPDLSAFALAGSGNPFNKTTHNGQNCGISDVAGNIFKINPGLTSIGTTATISSVMTTNPVKIGVTSHGRTTGDRVEILYVGGTTELNDKLFAVTVVDANTLSLDGVDGTAFTTYTSGGTLFSASFHMLKPSADMTTIGWGDSASTDHWGAAGVAVNFDPVTLNFRTAYPNNYVYAQLYGNGVNAVFDWSTPDGRALAMAGLPAADGVSNSGTDAMSTDYYYVHMLDQLCMVSRGSWGIGVRAGFRARFLTGNRSGSSPSIGFAASCFVA